MRLYKTDSTEEKKSETVWSKRIGFQDVFTFHICTDFEFPLTVFSLVISVLNYNLIGRDEVIGYVILSLDSPQSTGLTHWRDVAKNPQEEKEYWHYLMEPNEIK